MKSVSTFLQHAIAKKAIVLGDQVMVSASNFLLGILLVRWMGLSDYGVFALLWMGVLFALGINQAWVTKPLLSIAPKMEKNQVASYLVNLHLVQCLTSIVFLLLGALLYGMAHWFFDAAIWPLIPLTSALAFCQLQHDFYRKTSLVKQQFLRVFCLDGIFYGGQILGIIALYYFGNLQLVSVLAVLVGVNLISVIVGAFGISWQGVNRTALLNIFVRHFHFSKWLLGTSVLQWLSGNYFIIVGASILGTKSVGAIRLVQNVMGLCHILFLTMENLIPIEAAKQYHLAGENALTLYLRKMTYHLGAGFACLLFLIAYFAPEILQLIYGPTAVEHAYIVAAYVGLYFLVFLGHPFRFFMRTIEQTAPIFVAYVLSAIFSLITAKGFVTYYGMHGLLLGLIATQLISLMTYYFYLSPKVSNRIIGVSS